MRDYKLLREQVRGEKEYGRSEAVKEIFYNHILAISSLLQIPVPWAPVTECLGGEGHAQQGISAPRGFNLTQQQHLSPNWVITTLVYLD